MVQATGMAWFGTQAGGGFLSNGVGGLDQMIKTLTNLYVSKKNQKNAEKLEKAGIQSNFQLSNLKATKPQINIPSPSQQEQMANKLSGSTVIEGLSSDNESQQADAVEIHKKSNEFVDHTAREHELYVELNPHDENITKAKMDAFAAKFEGKYSSDPKQAQIEREFVGANETRKETFKKHTIAKENYNKKYYPKVYKSIKSDEAKARITSFVKNNNPAKVKQEILAYEKEFGQGAAVALVGEKNYTNATGIKPKITAETEAKTIKKSAPAARKQTISTLDPQTAQVLSRRSGVGAQLDRAG